LAVLIDGQLACQIFHEGNHEHGLERLKFRPGKIEAAASQTQPRAEAALVEITIELSAGLVRQRVNLGDGNAVQLGDGLFCELTAVHFLTNSAKITVQNVAVFDE